LLYPFFGERIFPSQPDTAALVRTMAAQEVPNRSL